MKKNEINIFIFRRDLRYQDNLALNALLETHVDIPILPIFIFNPQQIDPKINQYFNNNAVEFMIQCLKELERDLVYFFEGSDIDILTKLLNIFQINTIAFNTDYTPFATQRDATIKKWCESKNIDMITRDDYTLLPLPPKKTYQVFTPFYNNFMAMRNSEVAQPSIRKFDLKRFVTEKSAFKHLGIYVKNISIYIVEPPNQKLALVGGRSQALAILNRVKRGEFANYEKMRSFPAANKTTRISAYLKYGCVSVREAFQVFRPNKPLTRELLYREFYAYITYTHPRVLQGQLPNNDRNKAFKEKYESIRGKHNPVYWKAWISGKTGFPFVDAGIRQLLTTGFCHNRLRMVLGMFFSKDMMMDWIVFERWMAMNLIDYDPSSNSSGTQWCFSIGTDGSPYYRVFNPFMQSERFDPKCEYIKKWVPELKAVPVKSIHNWDVDYELFESIKYPKPMLNHREQVATAITLYKNKSV